LDTDQELVVDQNENQPESDEVQEEQQQVKTEEDGEIEVKIGDSPSVDEDVDQEGDSEAIRNLRAANRERAKREREAVRKAKELEQELQKLKTEAVSVVKAPGQKPQLSDFDYDADQYEASLTSWFDTKRKYEEHQAKEQQKQQQAQNQYQERLTGYKSSAETLKTKARDYQEAEDEVVSTLSVEQQNILLLYGDKPELTVYGLGKNRTELERIAKIKDPLLFAKELGRLESSRNVTNKPKSQVQVEKPVTSGTSRTISNKLLEAALEKAQQSGSMDEYRRLKKAQAK